jgi:peptide/nickel transport system substrate-binding protein
MVCSPKALKEMGPDFGQHPVGSGPFKFVEWVPEDHLTMERWDDYTWGPAMYENRGPAWLDQVILKPIYEAETAMGALEAGEINLLEDVPMEMADRVKANPDLVLIEALRNGLPMGWLPNVQEPPTDELAVRQALIHAIDREALVPIYFGLIKPSYAPVTKGLWGYCDAVEDMYPYDPGKARQLLEEAGWQEGPDGIRVKDGQRLSMNDMYNPNMVLTLPRLHEALQAQLKEVGVELILDTRETAEVTRASRAGEVNLAYLARVNNDPDAVRNEWACDQIGGLNYGQVCDPEMDEMLVVGYGLPIGSEERKEHYCKVWQYAMERVYAIPLFELPKLFAVRENVHGVTIDTNGTYVYKYMDVYIA